MIGRPLDPDAPRWMRLVNWLWTTSLMVFCGYLAYWFNEPVWRFVYGILPNISMPESGAELSWAHVGALITDILELFVGIFWVGWFALFFLLFLVVYLPFEYSWQALGLGRGSGGSVGWRRLKGFLLEWVPTWLVVAWVFKNGDEDLIAGVGVYGDWLESVFGLPTNETALFLWIMLFIVILPLGAIGFLFWCEPRFWQMIGHITGPMRRWLRQRGFGTGGSADFGGLLDEVAMRFRRGDILLGASLYFSRSRRKMFKIGMHDDRHMLTIAGTRGGKGRSAIIPNLILWPHSALVIDPKGTNAAVTAARRGKGGGRVKSYLGQDVFVVDPFERVKGVKRSAFNPLVGIDVNALTVMEDIGLLADALVVPEGGQNAEFFTAGAKTIIAGVVAHLLMQEYETTPTLLDVRKALLGSTEELDALFGAMMQGPETGAGNLARAAASLLANAGTNERGAHFNTVTSNLRWLDSGVMAQVLERSDFDIGDLKNGHTTVYVVLPPYLMEEHKRFTRMFINLAIREMSKGQKSKTPVLFVLDEFFSLGPLSSLEKAAGLLAGENVKLWPILQNLGQIKELYPKSWEGFFAGSIVHIFAVGDLETLEFIMQMLGKTMEEIEVDGRLQRVVNQLLEVGEIGEVVARERGIQIIRRLGAPPLLLRRTNYDSTFSKREYAPDPDHEGS